MSFSKKLATACLLSVVLLSSSFALDTTLVYMWGYITDWSGNPVQGAKVSIQTAKADTVTDSTGMYSFDLLVFLGVKPQSKHGSFYASPMLKPEGLFFSVLNKTPEPVKIDIFNINGRKVCEILNTNLSAGNYQVRPFFNAMSSQVYLLRVGIGGQTSYLKVPVVGKSHGVSASVKKLDNTTTVRPLAKTAAVLDSMTVSAAGFLSETRPIESYVGTNYFILRTNAQAAKKKINLKYTTDMGHGDADVVPTWCTAIWVEDLNNTYLTSMFVTTWLSTVGYQHIDYSICPDWRGPDSTRWHNIRQADSAYVDAITKPTPTPNMAGAHTFDINPEALNLTSGTYRFAIESNVEYNFNILFTGDINVGGPDQAVTPAPTYIPSQDPAAKVEAIHSVSFTYK